jgi:hypothetical protein
MSRIIIDLLPYMQLSKNSVSNRLGGTNCFEGKCSYIISNINDSIYKDILTAIITELGSTEYFGPETYNTFTYYYITPNMNNNIIRQALNLEKTTQVLNYPSNSNTNIDPKLIMDSYDKSEYVNIDLNTIKPGFLQISKSLSGNPYIYIIFKTAPLFSGTVTILNIFMVLESSDYLELQCCMPNVDNPYCRKHMSCDDFAKSVCIEQNNLDIICGCYDPYTLNKLNQKPELKKVLQDNQIYPNPKCFGDCGYNAYPNPLLKDKICNISVDECIIEIKRANGKITPQLIQACGGDPSIPLRPVQPQPEPPIPVRPINPEPPIPLRPIQPQPEPPIPLRPVQPQPEPPIPLRPVQPQPEPPIPVRPINPEPPIPLRPVQPQPIPVRPVQPSVQPNLFTQPYFIAAMGGLIVILVLLFLLMRALF